ncbi:hypothetical protein PDESU_00254 [Pontiella desulfatans]|uniref:Endo-beta-1,6-galactanase-like domain-containing protein n=1 Tax=Pontiella desulfatans TaxID=2750659 RepID=A0A6C2TVM6_PONDE|nr:glycoside hydrolase [Pontiella desulfatans]VGO11708.1 hypothetical protein PDESU_00254 [Pontiella desulfatans]
MKNRLFFTVGFVALACQGETLVTLDFSKRAQTIENIGSSTGMHGDHMAKHWAPETVDAVADLLFSREFDGAGTPKGIGLSCFRIQIGAGGAGEEGGIRAPWRRTDCFLRADGSYDWVNQGQGVHYWRRKASEYEVPTVIGYLNSPPVWFTESGYVFKTSKSFTSNLKPEHYGNYAAFLTAVATHFQETGLPFSHISPVNEPQWYWDGVPGRAKQEGSPWTNEQIAEVVRLTDQRFLANRISTRLLIPEAAEYPALVEPLPGRYFAAASDQIDAFWNRKSPDYVGNLKSVEPAVAGHAYFSDGSVVKIINTREAVKEAVARSGSNLRFWQTEYSLLGEGWTGGLPVSEVDEMTAALLLARNIHADLTLANASAWQWWSSTEPRMGRVPRYCLIECGDDDEETYRATKLLWALGHYSRFVRPGMVRIEAQTGRPAGKDLEGLMASAYHDAGRNRWVMVLVNFSDVEQEVAYRTRMLPPARGRWETQGFLTRKDSHMQRFSIHDERLTLPPKSMATIVSGAVR